MSIFKDRVLLIAGGAEGICKLVICHALDNSAKEIRVIDNNEDHLETLREEILAQRPEAATRMRYCCAEVCDSESVDDSMPGVDLVLCLPALKTVTDVESFPANACCSLLRSVDNVMQSAIKLGAEKVVVIRPANKKASYKTSDLLAALLEKVVIAQGRYQMKGTKTTVCCAHMDGDVTALVDYAFAHANNADLVLKQQDGYCCQPCDNPDFECDDLMNI